MTSTVIFSPPLDKVLKEIRDALENAVMRRRILEAASKALAEVAAARPVEGAWNRAPGARGDNRWYQRGFGSRWKTRDGRLGGIQNSQNLQKSWRNEVQDEFTAAAFTDVTYAPYIHDPEQRVHWAASHGWKSTDELVEIFAPKFEEIALKEIDEAIKEFENG